ncbi:MAG TPA: trypsin-like peptidase domain-containing protein [Saprospiraceae bacterium]|nr:trypsin-like peptidase domain-containing protein [Saprospiraceae bacterium]HRG20140.1 trypsin-like peptidase domain-containing protein [Saprospiraceae bacterium]HRG65732.1 trypsin-like peptidase domain-containing protein [Saprospiraceae bacterium]
MSKSLMPWLEPLVVQIATPYATGTGFVLSASGLIVTNEHVVRDNARVVIEGLAFERQQTDVIYLDEKLDLAFLMLPQPSCELVSLLWANEMPDAGDAVLACGHPFGYKFSITRGIISSVEYELGALAYFQHDAALNPGNSGGPLLSMDGRLLGINTFMVDGGQNIGIALPYSEIKKVAEAYKEIMPARVVKCVSCNQMLEETTPRNRYCLHCGAKVKYISDAPAYEAFGISKKIEEVLIQLGYDVAICRRGVNNWEISQGSAKVNIVYHEPSGFLIADATLCYLPNENMTRIYTYLMKQNYHNKGMTFALKDNNIVISSLIYDQHMHFESCKKTINKLIKAADKYDNILIEQFGATAIS